MNRVLNMTNASTLLSRQDFICNKQSDYVSKEFIRKSILDTKTKFSVACHSLLQSA